MVASTSTIRKRGSGNGTALFCVLLIQVTTPGYDVFRISQERWNNLSKKEQGKLAGICPDFVIKLRRDSDEKYTLPARMEKYLRNGVRLGWVIAPFSQQTTIYQPDCEPAVVRFGEVLSGGAD